MKTLLLLLFSLSAVAATAYTRRGVEGRVVQTDGTQADVQRAIDAAPDDGSTTILIPDGTYTWSGSLDVSKALTLCGESATGVKINNSFSSGFMIYANSSAKGNVNIYWLHVKQAVSLPSASYNGELGCNRTEPSNYTVLVHDCTFDNAGNWGFPVIVHANGIIFWNDSFPGTGQAGGANQTSTGIGFICEKYGITSSWNTPDSFGTQDTTGLANTYVEDCSFANGSSSACNCEDNSRVVWRHNIMTDALFSSHGQDTGASGVRQMEVYDNTFIAGSNAPAMGCWVSFNGGSGVVFHNQMQDIFGRTAIQLNVLAINRRVAIPCQTAYPAARQVGQGWSASSNAPFGNPVVPQDGTGAIINPVYVWDNTGGATTGPYYVSPNQFTPDECGNGQLIGTYVQAGRDYFRDKAKPGYEPYPYPHPLHAQYALGGGGPGPSPTPSATPTPPLPTPTPTPQPTPTPPGGSTYSNWLDQLSDWIRAHPATPNH